MSFMKNLSEGKLYFIYNGIMRISSLIPDKMYLKMRFKARTGRKLNLKNPVTFNEKLQYLKLYDRKPEYTLMADKAEVKKLVASKIGSKYIVPALGVWDKFEDIDLSSLPDRFVLKCTHDSGSVFVIPDKSKADFNEIGRKIKISLSRNYYYAKREWPYRNIKPRILAEEFLEEDTGKALNVYKIFTFGGKPYLIQTIQNDKKKDETIDYFDTSWKLLELRQNFPNSKKPLDKPQNLDVMLELAAKLSEGMSHIRVDFYDVNGKVYFSEYTFYSDGGMAVFTPPKWDKILGDKIVLK